LDLSGSVTPQYEGRVLRRDLHSVVLEAHFNVAQVEVVGVLLQAGDRFVETYYDDRWYNVFEIFDPDSAFKGWYCNLSRPAMLGRNTISWEDLALDLWVWPDGRQAVLDEDEFQALSSDPAEREQVLRTLAGLQRTRWLQRPRP
jgi:predicted RNA-binding protein associated with RNAse of E/G family